MSKCPKITSAPNKGLYLDFKIKDDTVMLRFNDEESLMLTVSNKNRYVKDSCTADKIKETLKSYGVTL